MNIGQIISGLKKKLTDNEGLFQGGKFMPLNNAVNTVKQAAPSIMQSYANTYAKVSPYVPFAPQVTTPQQVQRNYRNTFFAIPNAQTSIQNFAQRNPGIANTLLKTEPFVNRVTSFMQQPYKPVSLPSAQTRSPVANVGYNFLVKPVAEGLINFPSNYIGGISKTGLDIGKMSNGENVPVKKLLGDIGQTGGAIMDASVLPFGAGAMKNVAQNVGRNTLKTSMIHGGVEGLKYGGTYGLLSALKNNQDVENLSKYTKNVLGETAQGGIAGGVFGGAAGGLSYGAGKLFNSLAGAYKKAFPKASDQEAAQAAKGFIRDELGRFSRQEMPKKEPQFYGDMRESLGLSRNGEGMPSIGMTTRIKGGSEAMAKAEAAKTPSPTQNFNEMLKKQGFTDAQIQDRINKAGEIGKNITLTPEQMAAKKKLPSVLFTTSKTKAEGKVKLVGNPQGIEANPLSVPQEAGQGLNISKTQVGKTPQGVDSLLSSSGTSIPDVKPKTTLLNKAAELKRIGNEKLAEEQAISTAKLQMVSSLSSNDLKDLSTLRRMANSKAGQEGDIETLYKNGPEVVGRVLNRMRELSNDYEGNLNRTDEELLNMALTLPSKNEARVVRPSELKMASELEKQARNTRDIVYNAEPKIKVVSPQQKAESDFKEWSNMVFRDATKQEKSKTDLGIKSVGNIIEESTQKGLREKYASNQKGNLILDKAGRPLDKELLDRAELWKDKPRLSYARETMDRNFEDIMRSDAPEMKARYLDPVKKAEAERIRWLNKERKIIDATGIKARTKESALVQKFGEGKLPYEELMKEVGGDTAKANKIIDTAKFFRQKYKEYLGDINTVLKRNGYDPIPERKDYFLHFREVTNVLEQLGIPQRDVALPTDVNGLTADFKPGKNFFSSALPRLTDTTDFDAIQGMDRYIDGASKQIFHTDNIQNLRLFEKSLRAKFAGTTHLTNFVADLSEYTNTLAGKKAMIDRAAESLLGRNIYAASNRLKKQVGANMVAANVSSALTNYIPLTQSLATTSKPSFLKGMMQTIGNVFRDDGFVDRSDFLTRRIGSDRLSTNLWDKVGDKAGWLFKAIDNFTSQTIVRSKFNEAIGKGMSPRKAMEVADNWAARIMADRSLGSTPTLFNSKTLGFLTQFQLEVNNQLSFMAKDIPRNFSVPGAASALGQLFIYSYVFNNIYEKLVGRRPAFDPIGVAQHTYEDFTNPEISKKQATKNLVGNVSDQLPFVSTFTGGRLPIGSAIPNPFAVVSGDSTVPKELKKLTYLLPPMGGNQAQKTIGGIQAYNQGFSQSDAGRVRYPIAQDLGNRVRTTLFGQYSTPEARKYFRQGETPLGDKQSEVLKQTQDKGNLYQQFMNKRNEEGAITTAKEELKKSGGTSSTVGNTILLVQPNGDIRTIDLSFQPKAPELTGNTELDKKLVSKYNSQISSKANDIRDLYEAGKITADEAEKQLTELLNIKSKFAKPKKIKVPKMKSYGSKVKKVKIAKIKMPKSPKLKLSKFKATKPKRLNVKGLISSLKKLG